jgi:hypothetical protein
MLRFEKSGKWQRRPLCRVPVCHHSQPQRGRRLLLAWSPQAYGAKGPRTDEPAIGHSKTRGPRARQDHRSSRQQASSDPIRPNRPTPTPMYERASGHVKSLPDFSFCLAPGDANRKSRLTLRLSRKSESLKLSNYLYKKMILIFIL